MRLLTALRDAATDRFALRMAWREVRGSGAGSAPFIASVAVGVAAIVAVSGFRVNAKASIDSQIRVLLGADLMLESRFPFPEEVERALDSLRSGGQDVARLVGVPTMVEAVGSGRTALLVLWASDRTYPFYGIVETRPPGLWGPAPGGGAAPALADPGAAARLGALAGDTLRVGEARIALAGLVDRLPGDPGVRGAVNPRVYIDVATLERTGVLQPGSLVTYRQFVKMGDRSEVFRFLRGHRELLRRGGITFETAYGRARDFRQAFDALGRFLGLAGLAALLLGMVGVASAMHVWVGRRLAGAAVLRCLGATGGTVVRIGIGEAAILAAAGSVVGIVLGVGLQAALPRLVGDLLPVDFRFAPDPRGALVGLAIGIWTATLFATRAILPLRHVPALGAIRRAALGSAEGAGGVRAPERLVDLALAATVTGLCVWQADRLGRGLGFAATLGAVLVVLHLLSGGLMRAARGARGARVPYAVRQGIANLFRPRNQTRAAVAGLGLGVFLMATVAVVERNLRARLSIDPQAANFALYDVPAAAAAEVSALLRAGGHPVLGVIPILPARIAAVKGVPATDLLDRSARRGVRGAPAGPPVGAWALRREYRNSVRDTLVESERLVAGTWWSGPRPPGVRVSLETEVARALNVGVGDTVTWDVQGRRVESEIASLREVEWARLEPNFVALFEPGSVEDLPASELVLTRIDDPGARATFIRQATERWPAVLLIDLTAIRATLEEVLGRAALVVRVLGGFLLLAGLLVVVSTTAAARGARSRESSLLRALGAGTFTLHGILAVEFFAIGAMAALAGIGSAAAAGWGLARWVLGIPYRVPVADLAWLALGVAALTLLVGALGSRAVVRVSALEAIRRAESAG